jgi:hypothetical protein
VFGGGGGYEAAAVALSADISGQVCLRALARGPVECGRCARVCWRSQVAAAADLNVSRVLVARDSRPPPLPGREIRWPGGCGRINIAHSCDATTRLLGPRALGAPIGTNVAAGRPAVKH